MFYGFRIKNRSVFLTEKLIFWRAKKALLFDHNLVKSSYVYHENIRHRFAKDFSACPLRDLTKFSRKIVKNEFAKVF